MSKNVLLIGGGGTLGGYTAAELLKRGFSVDVICLEKRGSFLKDLHYITAQADDRLLEQLFSEKHYDVIIDFLHYVDTKFYEKRAQLLLENTDQLIFLSSYRVYANEETPIRETSPLLYDVIKDPAFFAGETYAVPKTVNERFLRRSGYQNYTIVRPLISFSHYRLDLICTGASALLFRRGKDQPILLPEQARHLTAGLNWAGDAGKLFACLAGNEKALGETYTLGVAENKSWEEVAGIYHRLLGNEFVWGSTEEYRKTFNDPYYFYYDRLFDRRIDDTKIMEATGLTHADFAGIEEGLRQELLYFSEHPEEAERFRPR